MKISVITVCLNAEKNIALTIESVLGQTYKDYEYIVMDGGSTDKTVEIAKRYKSKFKKAGIDYRIISGHDSGIYNAMNNAADISRGEWINYLNAGDIFSDKYVLLHLGIDRISADVIYGDTIIKYPYPLYKRMKAKKINFLSEGMVFCHQSSFTRRECIIKYRFNERYELASDYDMFIRMYGDGVRFYMTGKVISIYDGLGRSSYDDCTMISEYNEIRYRNNIVNADEYNKTQTKLKSLWIKRKREKNIKKYIPQKLMNIIHNVHWYIKLRKDGYKRVI